MSTLAAPLPSTAIEQNIHCLRCGHNLRTLSTDARCPECSTPIASSLNWNLLRFADPSWTNMLALSLGLMMLASAIALIYTVVFLVLNASNSVLFHVSPLETAENFAKLLAWLGVFLL